MTFGNVVAAAKVKFSAVVGLIKLHPLISPIKSQIICYTLPVSVSGGTLFDDRQVRQKVRASIGDHAGGRKI